MAYKLSTKGFTLIELLVVIAIIGVLSSVVIGSVSSARAKARDAERRLELGQMRTASEILRLDQDNYPASAGWFSNPNHGYIDDDYVPTYISKIPDDPLNTGSNVYMYWRKDYVSGCLTNISSTKYGFYAKLENPSARDLATLVDSFDQCVGTTWGMNYKGGN